jgi:hypothetical protein
MHSYVSASMVPAILYFKHLIVNGASTVQPTI